MAQLVEEHGQAEGVSQFGDTKVIALIAYMKRLGTDLNKPVEVPAATAAAASVSVTATTPAISAGGAATTAAPGQPAAAVLPATAPPAAMEGGQ